MLLFGEKKSGEQMTRKEEQGEREKDSRYALSQCTHACARVCAVSDEEKGQAEEREEEEREKKREEQGRKEADEGSLHEE